MLREVVFELNVELDQAVHGDCHAGSFDDHYLEKSIRELVIAML